MNCDQLSKDANKIASTVTLTTSNPRMYSWNEFREKQQKKAKMGQ